MASALALVLVTLFGGYVARRLNRFPESAPDVLNRFVIDLCVPAAILRLIPKLTMRWDLLALVLIPWLLALVAYAISRGLGRWWRLDRPTRTVLFLCTALGNTSFLGFPLCAALLGERSLSLAAVYDQLGSFLLLSLVAPITLARAAGTSPPGARELLHRVVMFPPFVALLLALALALLPWPQPAWLDSVLAAVAAALVPIAMFAVGLRVRITPPRETRAFALGLLLKLGLMPLIALGITRAIGASADVRNVAVLESAMPSSITAGALLMAAGLAPELAAALVGWGVVAALVTVPAWAYLLR